MKPYAFGVDIGGTTVKIGFFSSNGKFVEHWEIPTRKEDNGSMILPDIASAIAKKIDQYNITIDDIEGVGVGVPGPVLGDGVVSMCVNLGWGRVDVRKELARKTGKEIYLEIHEVRDADANAQLVAENIAQQIERRVALRRLLKRAQKVAMDMGVDGIKIRCCGRINNAELSRVEWGKEGKVPLHTLRAKIDYGFAEANTTAGKIGVKVWICKSENFKPRMSGGNRRKSHAPNA